MSNKFSPHSSDNIIAQNEQGQIMYAYGTTVPSNSGVGYATGAIFIHSDGSAGDIVYINNGTAASSTWNAVPTGGVTGAADVGIADSGGFTANTTVEAALAEIYQHIISTGVVVPLPLASLREVDTNKDVGNSDANGGILASNTTPILRADSAENFELFWAATNVDQVALGITLPNDLDDTADAFVDLWVQANTTDQAPTFTVETSWHGGAMVSDTATAVTATTLQAITATIASGDIPADPRFVTIGLTPAAHATSAFQLLGARLRYKGKARTS